MLSDNRSRESLIYALNQSLHKEELPDIRVSLSHYDVSTGTMYCGENKTSYNSDFIKEAIKYFEMSEQFYHNSKTNTDSYKKGEYCKIAATALNILANSVC